MKRMLLATFLVAVMGSSLSVMAMDAPEAASSSSDIRTAGNDTVLQVGDAPLLLAAGDAWEARSALMSEPLSPKGSQPMHRREVRQNEVWWR